MHVFFSLFNSSVKKILNKYSAEIIPLKVLNRSRTNQLATKAAGEILEQIRINKQQTKPKKGTESLIPMPPPTPPPTAGSSSSSSSSSSFLSNNTDDQDGQEENLFADDEEDNELLDLNDTTDFRKLSKFLFDDYSEETDEEDIDTIDLLSQLEDFP